MLHLSMMALPRTQCLLALALTVTVVTFSSSLAASVSSSSSSPSSPFLFSGEREKRLSQGRRRQVPKRFDQEVHLEVLRFFSEKEVEEATKEEYTSIPQPLIYTSQILQQGVNCSNLESELHKNHIDPEVVLYPEWIYRSKVIGDCPTQYVSRELPPEYTPPRMLEAVCACGGSQCSEMGHQCVPLSVHVPVWVRRGPNLHVLDVEELTVACACAMRPSLHGNFIFSAAIQS